MDQLKETVKRRDFHDDKNDLDVKVEVGWGSRVDKLNAKTREACHTCHIACKDQRYAFSECAWILTVQETTWYS